MLYHMYLLTNCWLYGTYFLLFTQIKTQYSLTQLSFHQCIHHFVYITLYHPCDHHVLGMALTEIHHSWSDFSAVKGG